MHRYAKNGKVPVSNTVRVGYGNKYYMYAAKIFIFFIMGTASTRRQHGLGGKKKKKKKKEKKRRGFWPENKK